jgi:hypothetical protein
MFHLIINCVDHHPAASLNTSIRHYTPALYIALRIRRCDVKEAGF